MFIRELSTIPYNVKTYFIISDSETEIVEYINDNYNPKERVESNNTCAGFEVCITSINPKTNVESNICFIWLHDKYLKYLYHELIHLSWEILSIVEVKINNNNHEALTYLFDYLLEQCNDFIKEYGKFKRDNKK